MASYWLAGNHKHQPAAKHFVLIIITAHSRRLSESRLFKATHHEEQMLRPLHVFQELVSHAFVQVGSLNQARKVGNRNLAKENTFIIL